MENLEPRLRACEKRISKLEDAREKEQDILHSTKADLQVCVKEMQNLIKIVDSLPESIETSILKSLEVYKKDNEMVHQAINNVDKKCDEAMEEVHHLKDVLDERTIKKQSAEYSKIKWLVISTIVSSILGFIIGMVLK